MDKKEKEDEKEKKEKSNRDCIKRSCIEKMRKCIKNITKGMGLILDKEVIKCILTIILTSITISNGDICELIDLFAVHIIPLINKSRYRYHRKKLRKLSFKRKSSSSSSSSEKKQYVGRSLVKKNIIQDENINELLNIFINNNNNNKNENKNCSISNKNINIYVFLSKFFKKSIKYVAESAKLYLKIYHKIDCSFPDDQLYIHFEHLLRNEKKITT